jgi:hypothetical protein
VSTTAVTSLYDSGASSITSFGEATRIAIPCGGHEEEHSTLLHSYLLLELVKHILVAQNAATLAATLARVRGGCEMGDKPELCQHRDRSSQKFLPFPAAP